jgi:hypothetical protein
MRYENEPDQAANNQGHRDENYYLLQHVHIFSPYQHNELGDRNTPLSELSYKLSAITICFQYATTHSCKLRERNNWEVKLGFFHGLVER